jgi:hypothetical protein
MDLARAASVVISITMECEDRAKKTHKEKNQKSKAKQRNSQIDKEKRIGNHF